MLKDKIVAIDQGSYSAIHDLIGGLILLGVALFVYFAFFPISDRLYPRGRQRDPELRRVHRILIPSVAALLSIYAFILAIIKH
jgi:hypothetical protein